MLTPSRAEGFYLRSRLVTERTPLPGIRFWTPSDARKFLLAHYLPRLDTPTQADLRLLARACAGHLAKSGGADAASLRSVVREPAAFLSAYDLLLGAGWNPAREGAPYGRELAREFQRELEKGRIATQAGQHRELWRAALAEPRPILASLLVTGFNAAHWPLWDLLKAVALSTEHAVVALSQPRTFAESVDHLWHGSWEEFAKTEAIIPESPVEVPASAFSALAASYETGMRQVLPALDLTFCVTSDLATQVRGVVLRALDFLQRGDCARLGIVFPQANALALGVADELQRRGILANDGLGAVMPGIFEKRSWRAWLALQEEPGVPSLIAWLRACEAEDMAFGCVTHLTAATIAGVVESALGETLVDDLGFIAAHLEGLPDRHHARDVAEFLHGRIALPPEATFARFLELTRAALALRGWEFHRAQLEAEPPSWFRKSETVLPRRIFLEWLRESNDSHSRSRGRDGNHFYGKVHLLVYGQLSGQTWTHLILTGLNEGVWPRAFEPGAFTSRHELEALNQSARALNQRARTAGGQGEGQAVIREGCGHCLLPLERQDLALRDLCTALEAAHGAICLAAMSTEAGRALLPSDFFSHAYQVKTGRTLDEETFRRLANASDAWCRRHEVLFERADAAPAVPIEQTRVAAEARSDARRPFGKYEFAYDEPPERPIQLWAKKWEGAWNHPAQAWLEEIVGAEPWPEGTLSWPRAIGTWAHDWLAQALRDHRQRPGLLPLVKDAAERTARRVRERAAADGVPLYPWWEQVWAQARSVAVGLGENLEPLLHNRTYEVEYRIRNNVAAALPGAERADFELKGRIDLLLFPPGISGIDPTAETFSGTACWVVDFKTGSAKALNRSEVAKGRGLQTVLYALAVRSLGAGPTAISLLTRNTALKEQVDLDAALQESALFRSLDLMHRAGIFGMRPTQNEYGFSPAYPIATRFLPKYILETKWALVHGGEPGAGEDEA